MATTYQRKSSFTLGNIKSVLGANSVFASLSEAEKNSIINAQQMRIASFRNSLDHDTYKIGTDIDAASGILSATGVGYVKWSLIKVNRDNVLEDSVVTIIKVAGYNGALSGAVNVDGRVTISSTISEFGADTNIVPYIAYDSKGIIDSQNLFLDPDLGVWEEDADFYFEIYERL